VVRKTRGLWCLVTCSLLALVLPTDVLAQDKTLVLGIEGVTHYQVVLPDQSASEEVAQCLVQAGRLVQAAFKANHFDVPVVPESQRDPSRPAIYLGDTAFARSNGITPAQHQGWGYVLRVVGQDVIVAGRDEPSPGAVENPAAPAWPRLGTVKAVADFLRQYVGTRFVLPDVPLRSGVRQLAKVDLLTTPSIEYLPTPTITVPSDLNVSHTPAIAYSNAWAAGAGLYEIAGNRFPIVDEVFTCHSWARAIPEDKYFKDHPEYFALINGKRLGGMGANAQYCISNPAVQELLYQDLLHWLDQGYRLVDLGQPDGFRACQCEACSKLFDTGNDWSEKIWILHRNLAQRVAQVRPDRIVIIYSYIQTANPPRSFKQFPPNVRVALTGTEEHELDPWRDVVVPQGFNAYIYNWTANLITPYHPMRTPLYVQEQVRRFARLKVHGVVRDGRGDLHGLEGPVYYVMGRMFDDPAGLQARDLMTEYCTAAYGNVAPNMLRFYNELYHGIELYSQYLATRAPGWAYTDIFGRGKKHLSDPLQMIAFLYPPQLLETLEKELTQAEKSAGSAKVKARLALVRREFDWVRDLARAVHLYRAYEVQPDAVLRDRVLDALDARNARVESLYDARGGIKPIPGLTVTPYPPMGHSKGHLLLNYDGYQTPYKSTFLNWDTKAMRQAPLASARTLSITPLSAPATLDAASWKDAVAADLSPLAGGSAGPATQFRVAYDNDHLYVRLEAELPSGKGMEGEALELHLWPPQPGREVSYRFVVTPDRNRRSDAANGLVTDAMDPRYGQYDPDWEGHWTSDLRVDAAGKWVALLTIPFQTLGVSKPEPGAAWRGNVGRVHVVEGGGKQLSLWSASPSARTLDDRGEFGQFLFEASASAAAAKLNPMLAWRRDYTAKTFEIPPAWKAWPDPLPAPLDGWQFRPDPMEEGLKSGWFKPDTGNDGWLAATVPAFWSEIAGVGNFQGYGWYRVRFDVPASWQGRPITIGVASADEQAWVYLNGSLIREHTESSEGKTFNELWESPFTATAAPAQIKYGQSNVLVIRVLNSIANGGLWRPVLVHAAPKP
jgi:hypothetical protein